MEAANSETTAKSAHVSDVELEFDEGRTNMERKVREWELNATRAAAARRVAERLRETPPDSAFTVKQFAKEAGISEGNALRKLKAAAEEGELESGRFPNPGGGTAKWYFWEAGQDQP